MATYTATAAGSSTAVLEMHDIQAPRSKLETQLPESESSPREDPNSRPPTATEVAQRWNYPKSNVPKVAACFWSFVVMGANDAAYGVSLPCLPLLHLRPLGHVDYDLTGRIIYRL